MNLVLISAGLLGVVALLAAVLLYYISKAFQVEEDPRIDLVRLFFRAPIAADAVLPVVVPLRRHASRPIRATG